jgi:hypothetical protein
MGNVGKDFCAPKPFARGKHWSVHFWAFVAHISAGHALRVGFEVAEHVPALAFPYHGDDDLVVNQRSGHDPVDPAKTNPEFGIGTRKQFDLDREI